MGLSVAAGRLWGQADATSPTGTSWTIVALGVAGSALGAVAGVNSADWASRSFGGVERPDHAVRAVAGLTGSLAGTMIGTTLGAGFSHRAKVSFTGRLRDAGIGMMVGAVMGLVVAESAHDKRAGVIAFSVTQGLCAGLSNGRW